MLIAWPAIIVMVIAALSFGYGRWRRGRGSPVKARERIWFAMALSVICLPALVWPSILASSAMRSSDRVAAALATVAIGAVPLVVGLFFAGALRLVRLYIARAHARAEVRPKGPSR
jgi:hypothetical protein